MDFVVVRQETLPNASITYTYTGDTVKIALRYDCATCGGHGSPCRHCEDGKISETHTSESLRNRLGVDAYLRVCRTMKEAL